jgi:hypothetical protein
VIKRPSRRRRVGDLVIIGLIETQFHKMANTRMTIA